MGPSQLRAEQEICWAEMSWQRPEIFINMRHTSWQSNIRCKPVSGCMVSSEDFTSQNILCVCMYVHVIPSIVDSQGTLQALLNKQKKNIMIAVSELN